MLFLPHSTQFSSLSSTKNSFLRSFFSHPLSGAFFREDICQTMNYLGSINAKVVDLPSTASWLLHVFLCPLKDTLSDVCTQWLDPILQRGSL